MAVFYVWMHVRSSGVGALSLEPSALSLELIRLRRADSLQLSAYR